MPVVNQVELHRRSGRRPCAGSTRSTALSRRRDPLGRRPTCCRAAGSRR
ncbi:hypothetical protein QJS66_06675 [Kocuria rhizophila]|nr:hypothetical protein QJS66_06675 [Kocuria rhizophila]